MDLRQKVELGEVVERGRSLLRPYLISQGIEIQHGKFSCPNPNHPDNNPSCSIVPDTNDQVWHCHACDISGNVYTLAGLLHGLPTSGPEFITTVREVYKAAGEPMPEIEVSPEQARRIAARKLHKALYELMKERDSSGGLAYVDLSYAASRGWTEKVCLELGVGTFRDYNQTIEALVEKTGIENPEDYGISRALIGPDRNTFIISDRRGIPIGLSARTISGDGPKYINSEESLNPLFRKREILYGLHNALKFKDLRLDIFEGYADYVTAYQSGLKSCVAVGGVSLTDQHIDLLISLGFTMINVVFDADETGKKMMYGALEKFSQKEGIEISVLPLPEDGEEKMDVDRFIKQRGLLEYSNLRPQSLFDYKLSRYSHIVSGSPEAIKLVRDVLPVLVAQKDRLKRGAMASALSRKTGVPREDILSQVHHIESLDLTSLTKRVSNDILSARTIDEVKMVLEEASRKVSLRTRSQAANLITREETVSAFREVFVDMDSQNLGIHGWTTGYPILDAALDGITKPVGGGSCYGIAGAPQSGKSAIMLNIALNVAMMNEDASVLYWAIDDNRKLIAYRLLSMISGVPIAKVRRIKETSAEEEEAIRKAKDTVLNLTREGRLVFKDDAFGRNHVNAEAWINYTLETKPGSKILFCVDSLHNISGVDTVDIRTKLVRSSTWIKSLTSSVPITAMATLEIIKNRGTERPNLQDIAECGKIEFDFDVIGIAYNEAQAKFLPYDLVRAHWEKGGRAMPTVEFALQKNKTATGTRKSIFFHLDTDTTRIVGDSDTLPNSDVIDLPGRKQNPVEIDNDTFEI